LNLTKDPDKYETLSSKLIAVHLDILKDFKISQSYLLKRVSFFESLNDSQRVRASHCEFIRIALTQRVQEPEREDDELMKQSLMQVSMNGLRIQLKNCKLNFDSCYF